MKIRFSICLGSWGRQREREMETKGERDRLVQGCILSRKQLCFHHHLRKKQAVKFGEFDLNLPFLFAHSAGPTLYVYTPPPQCTCINLSLAIPFLLLSTAIDLQHYSGSLEHFYSFESSLTPAPYCTTHVNITHQPYV